MCFHPGYNSPVNGSKKSPQRPPAKALDLGLGAIIAPGGLSGHPPSTPAEPDSAGGRASPREAAPGAASTTPTRRVPPLSEYGSLAARGEWGTLLSLTERQTSGGGHGELAPRFWWVRASVALGSVPLTILAAPLETVTREIAETAKRAGAGGDRELIGAAGELLIEVSEQLSSKGDHATALSFAERAFRLDPGARGNLIRIVTGILGLPEPSPRRDPAGVRLRARCRALSEELGVSPALESTPAARAEIVSPSDSVGLRPERSKGGPRGNDISVRPLIIVLLAAVVGAAAMRFLSGAVPDAGGETTIALVAADLRPELMAPSIERLTGLSQLDAIFYDIDGGGERRAALLREARAPTAAPTPPRSGSKDIVDTQGPVEPVDVVQALRAPRERPEDDVGEILFGAPKPRFPSAQRGEPKPLPVDRFTAEREFVVMTGTRVLTRPSLTGRAVAELRSGDRVRAEEMVGDWLKIRSRNGQVGYILSQDVKAGGSGG